MKEERTGLLVGLFVVAGLVLLGVVIVILERDTFSKSYKITGSFTYGGGIEKGTPVHLAGVQIGKVSEIKITGGDDPRIYVIMAISEKYRIKKDAQLVVESVGLIGERVLEFSLGTPKAPYLPVDDSAFVDGVVSPTLSDIQKNVNTGIALIQDDIRNTLKHLSDLLASPEVQSGVKKTITNAADMAQKGANAMDKVAAFTEKINSFLDKANAFVDKANMFADKANQFPDSLSELVKDLKGTTAQLSVAVDNINSQFKLTTETLNNQIKTTGNDISQVTAGLKQNTETIQKVLESVNNIALKIENSDSTASLLINKRDFYDNGLELLSSMQDTVQTINETIKFIQEHPDALFFGKESSARDELSPAMNSENELDWRNRR